MVDFFVPGLSRDAAELLYVRLVKEAGERLKYPTARLRLIRWTGEGVGEPTCTASVGEDIDCGPNPQGVSQVYVSTGATQAIIETETLVHIYTATSQAPVTIVSDSIGNRTYFDDFRP